jgi:hypothetical protein
MLLFYVALLNHWFGPGGKTSLEFCETLRHALIKQPSNTWSNLGFMLTGLWIGWEAMKQKYIKYDNRLTRTLFFPTFLATLTVLLCPGSMAMHASTAIVGGYFDMLSMYLIAAFMFSYAFIRLFNLHEAAFFVSFLVVLAICHWVHFHKGPVFGFIDVNVIFGFFTVLAAILEFLLIYIRRASIHKKWAFAFCITFTIAFAVWNVSKTGAIFCVPDSWIQGHAIWHLLNALTIFFLFRYYISENDTRPNHVRVIN